MPRGLGRREGWRWREATVRLYLLVKRQCLPDTWFAKFAYRDGFANQRLPTEKLPTERATLVPICGTRKWRNW